MAHRKEQSRFFPAGYGSTFTIWKWGEMYMALVAPLAAKAPVPPLEWDRERVIGEVKEALSRVGGVMHGGSMREIRGLLGFDENTTPVGRIQGSLWHLTQCGVLEYHGRKPEGLCSVSES